MGNVNVSGNGVLSVGNGGGLTFIGGGNSGSGLYGTGTLTISGNGQVNVAAPGSFPNDKVYLGGYGGSGTINLNGGTLTSARDIVLGSGGPATVNFNGGTLKAAENSTTFLGASLTAVNVLGGGATIDDGGYNVTISTPLLNGGGGGGLTKNGSGTVILNAANTYTGGTTVNAGTLQTTVTGTLGATSGALSVAGRWTSAARSRPSAPRASTAAQSAMAR